MVRKLILSLVFVVLALAVFAPLSSGQQAVLAKRNPFLSVPKDPSTPAGAVFGAAIARAKAKLGASADSHGDGPQLQTFSYTVTSSRDGNVYSGELVGRSPFFNPDGFTAIGTHVVPLIIVTNSVFAGVDSNGNVLTAPGVTVFDPTVPDDSCLTAPNDVPLRLLQQSPIFRSFDFNFGGTDVGTTQTTDAFQRGNFFQLISGDNHRVNYHVILSPVRTVEAIVINIPASSGVAYPSAAFGGCPTGAEAIIDLAVYAPDIVGLFTQLTREGVNPSNLPMFTMHNVVECEAFVAGANCSTLSPNTGCCVLGFHDAVGPQTFASVNFDTSAIFVSPVPDVSTTSHEVAEWMNDPFANNPTPAWGHTGQVSGCQGNLEVGDPLSGTLAPPIFNPQNGFTYHMQELAFFSWFYGTPSVGVNGWFSDNGTFLKDAGPVCQ